MGQPAATLGSQIVAVDTHIVMIPSPGGPIPTPLPSPFSGQITGGTIASVKIMGQPAAVVGSTADNMPPHIPAGGPFQNPPPNSATVFSGSATVLIGGKQAARNLDTATTCDDIAPTAPKGQLIAVGTVLIGG
ncbi:PAAR domain-containing protein [Variovorax sp. J22R133]|uniref:PAAR domain-containing protein n=1 Tax=Variovorax brevis TaxID=3053503 RepID=UPI002578E794|nr:PAAR domain-containing protein [Variovorax sp. J22R133]MDM0110706.1 PAAR domain-containing protein [Variovorax sp. J22R133]